LNKLKTLLFLLGRPIFFLLLGRPTCSRRSPCSFSLSLAFFPTRAPLDPSRSRELRAPAPGRYRASCPLRRVARLDPFLSLLPFFPWVPEHFPIFFRAAQRRAHPTITAPVVAASLSAAWTPPFPRYVAAGQTHPPPSLFPVWAHASHPRPRWPPHLASLPPHSPVRAPPPPSHGTSMPELHSHGHDRRAPDPCVISFRRCQSQSSPSSSKSPEPPSVAPLLRAGPLQVLCAPPAMALSHSPSGPVTPPRPPPHPGAPHRPTQRCSPPLVRSAAVERGCW
jgi:hypothetical protein